MSNNGNGGFLGSIGQGQKEILKTTPKNRFQTALLGAVGIVIVIACLLIAPLLLGFTVIHTGIALAAAWFGWRMVQRAMAGNTAWRSVALTAMALGVAFSAIEDHSWTRGAGAVMLLVVAFALRYDNESFKVWGGALFLFACVVALFVWRDTIREYYPAPEISLHVFEPAAEGPSEPVRYRYTVYVPIAMAMGGTSSSAALYGELEATPEGHTDVMIEINGDPLSIFGKPLVFGPGFVTTAKRARGAIAMLSVTLALIAVLVSGMFTAFVASSMQEVLNPNAPPTYQQAPWWTSPLYFIDVIFDRGKRDILWTLALETITGKQVVQSASRAVPYSTNGSAKMVNDMQEYVDGATVKRVSKRQIIQYVSGDTVDLSYKAWSDIYGTRGGQRKKWEACIGLLVLLKIASPGQSGQSAVLSVGQDVAIDTVIDNLDPKGVDTANTI